MKILLYTQFCTPEPIFKSIPFAAELQRRGHEVRILTGFPNYPGGRVYPGYRVRPLQREVIEGVQVLRVPLIPSHGDSIIGRAINYASFAATSALPLLGGWRPDVIYIYNLVTLGCLAAINHFIRRIPYVIDVQDLWPDSVFLSGMGRPWMRASLEAFCRFGYRGAARVVTLSPGMADALQDRGVDPSRLRTIYNWCDEQALCGPSSGTAAPPPGFAGRFNILYAGNMGTVQALDQIIDAAALVARRAPQVQFVFMGKGVLSDALQIRARTVAPSNTLFLPARPMQEASLVMGQADVLLLHLRPSRLFEFTIPSKTQAYMALGRPILAAIGRDAGHLVEQARAGIGCRPGDPESIADAAVQMSHMDTDTLARMGRDGRAYYRSELSLSSGVTRWEAVFSEVVTSS